MQHLREAIRDTVADLGYNPVMSEYGGVGYINQGQASNACYIAIKQCHLAVLVIGKRYGSVTEDGISVTHKEFLAASENEIALITFVDSDVMKFKKVFDADPKAALWEKFPHMDQPKLTFQLVTDVMKAPTYNALIEYSTASEVKQRLKQHFAHYVGDRLGGTIRPIMGEVSDILAEVKTLRNLITQAEAKKQAGADIVAGSNRYYTTVRFLLDDRRSDYKKFVEVLFGDIDVAVKRIADAESLDQVMEAAGAVVEMLPEGFDPRSLLGNEGGRHMRFMSHGQYGVWLFMPDHGCSFPQ